MTAPGYSDLAYNIEEALDGTYRLTNRLRHLGFSIAYGVDIHPDDFATICWSSRTLYVSPGLTVAEHFHCLEQTWRRLVFGPDAAYGVLDEQPPVRLRLVPTAAG